jgi:methionyl-tRNA formyltransferase
LVVRALDQLDRGELEFADQNEAQATYAEKISPEERRLDPSRPVEELERKVRALTPHVGAYLELGDGERLGIREAEERRPVGQGPADPPGTLVVEGSELLLVAGDGILQLEVVQPPGKKPMSAADFLRGHDAPANAV